jgi:hypothetical protein
LSLGQNGCKLNALVQTRNRAERLEVLRGIGTMQVLSRWLGDKVEDLALLKAWLMVPTWGSKKTLDEAAAQSREESSLPFSFSQGVANR